MLAVASILVGPLTPFIFLYHHFVRLKITSPHSNSIYNIAFQAPLYSMTTPIQSKVLEPIDSVSPTADARSLLEFFQQSQNALRRSAKEDECKSNSNMQQKLVKLATSKELSTMFVSPKVQDGCSQLSNSSQSRPGSAELHDGEDVSEYSGCRDTAQNKDDDGRMACNCRKSRCLKL